MKTKKNPDGTIFYAFDAQEKGLLHSLFARAMPASSLTNALHERLEESKFQTCYIREKETDLVLALLVAAKADLEEESEAGGHDEKIGSTEEGYELLRLITEIAALLSEGQPPE